MKYIVGLILSLGFLLTIPSFVYAADYYVSNSGSDTNPGTLSSPWKTIAKGVSVLNPGDNLYIRSGTYLLTSGLNISHSGTATARITISTMPGDTMAIISGDTNGNGIADTTDTPTPSGWFFIHITGSYVTLQNLDIGFAGAFGIYSAGHDNIVSGNKVHNTWYSGIQLIGANSIAEYNTVWRTVESNYCGGVGGSRGCNGDWGGAIAWGDSSPPFDAATNTTIRHNIVFNNSGEALICMLTDGGSVEDNVVYDNWGLGIYLAQCSNYTIQRNLLYYTSDKNWWRGGTYPGDNILLAHEGNSGYTIVQHDEKIINNIMINGGNNIRFWAGWIPSALISTTIANNTFIEASYAGTSIEVDMPLAGSPAQSNNRISNNLFYQPVGTFVRVGTMTGLAFDHNLWSKTPPSGFAGIGDIIANPLLVDPSHALIAGSVLPDWYKLTASSPAINAGANLSALGVTNDFASTLRPQGAAFDIGAYEFVSGTTPTSVPSTAPTSTPTIKPGDANGDGKVDEADYAIWLAHYTQHIAGGASVGDFNGDGVVDGIDFCIWTVHYGN